MSEAHRHALTRVQTALATLTAEQGQVQPLADEVLPRTLPHHLVCAVVFPQYPVARVLPHPLNASVLYAVPRQPGEPPRLLPDIEAVKTFFAAALGEVRDEDQARDAVRAWLHLAAALVQDGYYTFSPDEGSLKVTAQDGHMTATMRSVVIGGGNGEILATLTFDEAGRLRDVAQSVAVRRGVRPRCQATKLLDADAIVRAMAEQDILVMGGAAWDYLQQSRADAGPDLRQAIDHVWQRICDEGR